VKSNNQNIFSLILPKRSKYRAIKTRNANGVLFDSKKEARLDPVIMMYSKSDFVKEVIRKKVYPIVINGVLVCKYVSDWTILFKNGTEQVYDAKGYKTQVYKLKKKLMKAVHNLTINEL